MAQAQIKVVSVVGARPQFIKLAPMAKAFGKKARHIIIHSGQHYNYEMSQAFFDQLSIPDPDINLGVGSGSHGRQTGKILEKCEKALLSIRPDMVLVYGDTNTTLAAALAAAKLAIPVGHIEAGLRSFRKAMPEEINRVMADHISDLLFYPTPTARRNLKSEGITRGLVRSGDVMYEILDSFRDKIKKRKEALKQFGLSSGEYLLVTLHRAENADDRNRMEKFVDILEGIKMPKLFLAHPRTIKNLKRFGLSGKIKKVGDLIFGPPQPYLETLALISHAAAVMTDSGGIQKEAYFLGKGCLTLRQETEWVETVSAGSNFLVDLSPPKINRSLNRLKMRSRKIGFRINGRLPSETIARAVINFVRRER